MDEYEKGVSISSLFSLGSMGITTGHDKEMVSLQSFKSDYNFSIAIDRLTLDG